MHPDVSMLPQTGREPAPSEFLTVLVACLNEAEMVDETVRDILRVGAGLPIDFEVLLIDDGSTDGTRDRMEAICAAESRCRMIVNERNMGLGRAVLSAYAYVRPGSWVTVMPGDAEILFESIHGYLRIRHDYDVILGYLQNPVIRTLTRRIASFVFSKAVHTLYGFPYRYLNGLKLYRVEAFQGIPVLSTGHAFSAELLAKAQLRNPMLRVGEAPFANRGRAGGGSKAFRLRSILHAVRDVALGYRSVARYREECIREQVRPASPLMDRPRPREREGEKPPSA
ncbi:MAG: glycosyltransferase family 2 protein [Deltaproteobacteria bacterium]|nr:glycosyltransferase family 2 protein [Deltaproteobacteria bacterium]